MSRLGAALAHARQALEPLAAALAHVAAGRPYGPPEPRRELTTMRVRRGRRFVYAYTRAP